MDERNDGYRMKRFLSFLGAFLFLLVPCGVQADISVSLKLDRSEATVADSVRMVVSVSGTRKTASAPVLHGVELFTVTPGGTSSRVEVINGRVNASVEYSYILEPGHTGTFKIGPAELTVEGKTYRSDTARLLVSKPARAAGGDRGPLFLEATLSSGEVYVEEQTLYTLRLYRRTTVRDISLSVPEIEHLAFTQLGEPREYQSVYKGTSYQVLEVRYALVPSRAGTYAIGPSRMNMTVLQPGSGSGGNIFDNPLFKDPFFSFRAGRPMRLASQAFELKVSPLPEEGRPADFSGLVGSFEMTSDLEPAEVKTGESATLTVRVGGRGNVNLIPDLTVPEGDQTKIYADQPVLKAEQDARGLGGVKTMKWALVPEKTGRLETPSLRISYFDTETHQYRTLRTSTHTLSVLPGKEEKVKVAGGGKEADRLPGPAKEAVKELGRDILPVHTSMKDFTPSSRIRPSGWVFWAVLLAPILVYGTAAGAVRYRRRSIDSLPAARAKKAARDFVKQCRRGEDTSRDLARSVRDYLNNRFNLSLGVLTPDEATRILLSRGVGPDRAERMGAILRRLEDAVYTGRGDETCERGEDLADLIRQIEKEIR
jgi:hypothetical protein